MRWHTSTHRCPGGNCVEVGWHASTHSNPDGNCVEITHTPAQVYVRDSKHRTGPTLTIPAWQWSTFLKQLA
jgi:Domain of unknown function (DUF397)